MRKTSASYAFIAALAISFITAAAPALAEPPSRLRVTNADFPTQLRPEPDSFKTVGKIPPGTPITILDMVVVRTDKFKENWYRVEHEGTTGWVRGDDLEGETTEKKFSATYYAPELPGPSSPGGVQF